MPLAIGATDQPIGFFVANDSFTGRIELKLATNSAGDIAEVAERRRKVTDFDVGVGAIARSNAIDEVAMVGRS